MESSATRSSVLESSESNKELLDLIWDFASHLTALQAKYVSEIDLSERESLSSTWKVIWDDILTIVVNVYALMRPLSKEPYLPNTDVFRRIIIDTLQRHEGSTSEGFRQTLEWVISFLSSHYGVLSRLKDLAHIERLKRENAKLKEITDILHLQFYLEERQTDSLFESEATFLYRLDDSLGDLFTKFKYRRWLLLIEEKGAQNDSIPAVDDSLKEIGNVVESLGWKSHGKTYLSPYTTRDESQIASQLFKSLGDSELLKSDDYELQLLCVVGTIKGHDVWNAHQIQK